MFKKETPKETEQANILQSQPKSRHRPDQTTRDPNPTVHGQIQFQPIQVLDEKKGATRTVRTPTDTQQAEHGRPTCRCFSSLPAYPQLLPPSQTQSLLHTNAQIQGAHTNSPALQAPCVFSHDRRKEVVLELGGEGGGAAEGRKGTGISGPRYTGGVRGDERSKREGGRKTL